MLCGYKYIYIYIYTYRERDTHVCICVYMYIYIYIYICLLHIHLIAYSQKLPEGQGGGVVQHGVRQHHDAPPRRRPYYR